jgi:phosphoribosylanthranilate isomerase
MALKTFVKIGGITNLSDARYCSGMYVNLLGFSAEQGSEKYVSPAQFSEISGWLCGLEYVGEFEDASADEVLETLKNYPAISWAEHRDFDILIELKNSGLSLIYKADLEEVRDHEYQVGTTLSEAGIILHLTSNQEILTAEDLDVINLLSERCEIILGAGLSSENVLDLLSEHTLKGIALTGGTEIKPGLKDFDELADILEKLEIEE